ncbi:MAG: metallophosphoesterase family protein [Oscillospiraceae bacterium]|nr:metallophosphoesterase family protein [Oscillospiraceae bacterium]
MKVGILSDTHDLLRPEAAEALQGCVSILHCGDIGSLRILEQLEQIAPVTAVRGNADREWAENLPAFAELQIAGLHICMTHKKKDLPGDLGGYDLALFGHSHQYSASRIDIDGRSQTLVLNPGSCGPRRFHQSITMAVLRIGAETWDVERIDLHPDAGETIRKLDPGDLRRQVEIVMREAERGKPVSAIAKRHNMDPALVEQIARLYVTHPGVTADGILTKMGF